MPAGSDAEMIAILDDGVGLTIGAGTLILERRPICALVVEPRLCT